MPDTPSDPRKASPPTGKVIDERLLAASRLPFAVSLACVVSVFVMFFAQSFLQVRLFQLIKEDDSALIRVLAPSSLYIILFIITILSLFIGYRLVVAAGAVSTDVIPRQDYELLAQLVMDGKSESIDQYVRLSSLAKFTGTFTQLGLSGLPLATIFLTIFFSLLTIFSPTNFLDLTKLTLGAFIRPLA
jgi:hypothetical protein